jgi:hypothetical protein
MAVETIPVRSDIDYYAMTVALGENDFRLTFAYNTRDDRWYMDIAKADGTALVNGVPMVVDTPLLLRYTNPALPEGYLIATDTTGEGIEAAKEDFGDRVQLIFIPSSDL